MPTVERRDAQRVPHPQMHEQRPMYDQRSPMMQGQGGPSPGGGGYGGGYGGGGPPRGMDNTPPMPPPAAARRAAGGPGLRPGDGAADGPAADAAGPGVRRRPGAEATATAAGPGR